jgi:xylulokinase
MGKEYFIGLDVGTSGAKALVFCHKGEKMGEFYQSYSLKTPYPGWVEQDVEEIWEAVLSLLRSCGSLLQSDDIAFLSLSTQGGTVVLLDEQGSPLRPAITWMDSRAKDEGLRLLRDLGRDFIYHTTGYGVVGSLPLSQLCWLKNHEPETLYRAYRISPIDSFITLRLTGEWYTDLSSAGITMLYDISERSWSEALLRYLGICEEQLPRLRESGSLVGEVLPEIRRAVNLPITYVVTGGHDQFCASLAVGATTREIAHLSGGTAWAMVLPQEQIWWDPQGNIAVESHVVPKKYGLLLSIPCGGASLEWFRTRVSSLGGEEEPYTYIDQQVAMVPPGSEGVFFLPYFIPIVLGTPGGNKGGVFVGLGLHHNRYHLYRSIMEGLCFEILRQVEYLQRQGKAVTLVRLSGGVAKSQVWTKITAQVFSTLDIRLERVKIADASAVGAAELAYLCWLGGGKIASAFEENLFPLVKEEVSVDASKCKEYLQWYEKWCEVASGVGERGIVNGLATGGR